MDKRAAVFLAEGFEEIEAVTVIDVLRRSEVEVVIVGIDSRTIRASRGVVMICEQFVAEIKEDFDAYILPGGMPGAVNLAKCEAVRNILLEGFRAGKIIAAICASPAIVLSPLGLLKGKSATCYPGMESEFDVDIRFKDKAVIVDETIITSRGPATAMKFALAIAENLMGKEMADKVSQGLLMPTV